MQVQPVKEDAFLHEAPVNEQQVLYATIQIIETDHLLNEFLDLSVCLDIEDLLPGKTHIDRDFLQMHKALQLVVRGQCQPGLIKILYQMVKAIVIVLLCYVVLVARKGLLLPKVVQQRQIYPR